MFVLDVFDCVLSMNQINNILCSVFEHLLRTTCQTETLQNLDKAGMCYHVCQLYGVVFDL